MAKQTLFISSVQGEFQDERRLIAEYIHRSRTDQAYYLTPKGLELLANINNNKITDMK